MNRIFLMAALLATTSLGLSKDLFAQIPKLSAEEILSRHLSAVGGKAALSRFKTRAAIGTVHRDDQIEREMVIMSEAPNRISARYRFQEGDVLFRFDGVKPAVRPVFGLDMADIQAKYNDMMASGFMFNSISLYNQIASPAPGIVFEAKGTKEIHGRAAYAINVKSNRNLVATVYIDAESYMWVRTEFGQAAIKKTLGKFTNSSVNHGEDDTIIDFYCDTSDFRVVDGVKLPFRFVHTITAPILGRRVFGEIGGTITEYRHNVPIDPVMFQ